MNSRAFWALQTSKLIRLASLFRRGQWAKILVILTTLVILLLLALGIFYFSLTSFKFLSEYPIASQPIITYSLAATFILTAVLVLASAVITSLQTLFQRDDNSLVFSWPIPITAIFSSRLLNSLLLANWPMLVFSLPFILGYSAAFGLNWTTRSLFLIGLIFLSLSSSLLGTMIALIASRIWGNLQSRWFNFALLASLPIFGWVLVKVLLPDELTTNLGPLSIEEIGTLLGRKPLLASFLPTTWLVNLVYFWPGSPSVAALYLATLASFWLTLILVVSLLRQQFYWQAINKTSVGRFIAAPWDTVKKKVRSFPYLLPGKMGALTEKDWLGVLRSPPQLFQLFFIIFIGIVYLLIISRVPLTRLAKTFPTTHQTWLKTINFLFTNYLAAVFSLRFLFPLISLEGHSAWVSWSAPLPRLKIFWQKLVSSFLLVCLSTEAILLISKQWSLLLINLPVSFLIVLVTLGIGAIKPNFWEKNPEKLSTTPGGLLATFVCLAYISLCAGLLFGPLRYGVGLIWLLSGLVAVIIFHQVQRHLNHYEL